jgi:hypothetical protein
MIRTNAEFKDAWSQLRTPSQLKKDRKSITQRTGEIMAHCWTRFRDTDTHSLVGINMQSLWSRLEHFSMAEDFPIKGMHTYFLNVAHAIAQHWSGSFFSQPEMNDKEYNLPKSVWATVGSDLANANFMVPAMFCHTLHDIAAPSVKYKAIKWQEFVLNLSMIVLQGRLPKAYLDHWAHYVCALQLALNPAVITPEELEDIDTLIAIFVLKYKE